MLDFKFSWVRTLPSDYAWAEELKGYNPNQPRDKTGRFGSGPGKTLVGQSYLDIQKVTGAHSITVHNSRVRKYKGHVTVESFIAAHKRGRAAAMRELTADHATGKISFGHPVTNATPAAAAPKAKGKALGRGLSDLMKENEKGGGAGPATEKAISAAKKPDVGAEKPAASSPADHSAAEAEAGRSLRGIAPAKPGASLKPLARDPKRSDLATLQVAHAQVAHDGEAARLSHIRKVLGNYSRPEQDRMLQAALHNPGTSLSSIDDNKAIDGIEKAAAYSPAGDPFHLLRAAHHGHKSVFAPELDEIDGTDLSRVTENDIRDLFDDALLASAGYA